jgi:hypothetical protein
MKKKRENNKHSSWYFYNWTFLGWLETGIKAVALIIGMWAFCLSRVSQIWMIPSRLQLVQWIVLGVLSLGIFVAIYNRWQNKEIVSMLFILFNNLGHWGMFLALTRNTGWAILPIFSFLMMLGDLIKIIFLRQQHYTEKNITPNIFIRLTLIFVLGYGIIGLLNWFN